jgi:hypothetical protein
MGNLFGKTEQIIQNEKFDKTMFLPCYVVPLKQFVKITNNVLNEKLPDKNNRERYLSLISSVNNDTLDILDEISPNYFVTILEKLLQTKPLLSNYNIIEKFQEKYEGTKTFVYVSRRIEIKNELTPPPWILLEHVFGVINSIPDEAELILSKGQLSIYDKLKDKYLF